MINWINNNISDSKFNELLHLYLRDQYPSLSKILRKYIIILLHFCDCEQEFHITISGLQNLFSCQERRVYNIINELIELNILTKTSKPLHNGFRVNANSLYFSFNLPEMVNLKKLKTTTFFATYVKVETTNYKNKEYQTALFKDVHNVDKSIQLKSYKIGYDQKNSEFLEQLKSGDIISFTPPITVPIIKNHNPADLNLTLLSSFFVKKNHKNTEQFYANR
jgi:hypothetical protein